MGESLTEQRRVRDEGPLGCKLFSQGKEDMKGNLEGKGRGLFLKYRHIFFLEKRGLQPGGLRPSRGVAPSGFRPLRKIPHCYLP